MLHKFQQFAKHLKHINVTDNNGGMIQTAKFYLKLTDS